MGELGLHFFNKYHYFREKVRPLKGIKMYNQPYKNKVCGLALLRKRHWREVQPHSMECGIVAKFNIELFHVFIYLSLFALYVIPKFVRQIYVIPYKLLRVLCFSHSYITYSYSIIYKADFCKINYNLIKTKKSSAILFLCAQKKIYFAYNKENVKKNCLLIYKLI